MEERLRILNKHLIESAIKVRQATDAFNKASKSFDKTMLKILKSLRG